MNPDHAMIEICVHMPHGESKAYQVKVPVVLFEARPRDREVPFAIESHDRDLEIMRRRQATIAGVAKILAAKLTEIIGLRDTINGYSPEEWAAMQQPLDMSDPTGAIPRALREKRP